ncbi:hypothetical protein SAMN04488038_10798 [Solimonas aquatica]|uniref:Uncharacterized protein n=1 Tax=Solimonas aquatica TaxID=489703 RepID=A0A1H9GJS8_9GAMM|nr:hypothetical protein [Solimonas aquatica]SEQ50304.1 hypothetical protein SAMN04488038_10798 [Solimonas aquatica]
MQDESFKATAIAAALTRGIAASEQPPAAVAQTAAANEQATSAIAQTTAASAPHVASERPLLLAAGGDNGDGGAKAQRVERPKPKRRRPGELLKIVDPHGNLYAIKPDTSSEKVDGRAIVLLRDLEGNKRFIKLSNEAQATAVRDRIRDMLLDYDNAQQPDWSDLDDMTDPE